MADTLTKVYNRFKAAEEIAVHQKADSTLVLLTPAQYNAMPQEFKDQYGNYGQYVAVTRIQYNAQKQAMRNKLDELKTALNAMICFDAAEKSQYSGEIDTAKTNIKDINGK